LKVGFSPGRPPKLTVAQQRRLSTVTLCAEAAIIKLKADISRVKRRMRTEYRVLEQFLLTATLSGGEKRYNSHDRVLWPSLAAHSRGY